jgi:hypothetical protein
MENPEELFWIDMVIHKLKLGLSSLDLKLMQSG